MSLSGLPCTSLLATTGMLAPAESFLGAPAPAESFLVKLGGIQDFSSVWIALAMLFVAAIVGVLIIGAVSRRLKKAPEDAAAFTLHDLRSLHRDGRLNDEEYDRMKAALLGMYAPDQNDDPDEPNVQ